MRKFTKFVALVLVVMTVCSIMPSAFAASKTSKGVGTTSYTITTGKKDATLTVTNKAGKVNATVWKNPLKGTTKTKTLTHYGAFEITVKNGINKQTKSINYPFNDTAKFTLQKNSTYTVTIRYTGFSNYINMGWDPVWKTNPSVKLSVNNSAKIK